MKFSGGLRILLELPLSVVNREALAQVLHNPLYSRDLHCELLSFPLWDALTRSMRPCWRPNETETSIMNRRRRIYEGKGKILYEGPEPGTLIQFFKDDATAFNKKKHEVIDGKGVLNNRISEYIFSHLNRIGIPTHFLRRLNMREQLIREVEMIPLEIVVRNVAAGSLAKRLGIDEGTVLPRSII